MCSPSFHRSLGARCAETKSSQEHPQATLSPAAARDRREQKRGSPVAGRDVCSEVPAGFTRASSWHQAGRVRSD